MDSDLPNEAPEPQPQTRPEPPGPTGGGGRRLRKVLGSASSWVNDHGQRARGSRPADWVRDYAARHQMPAAPVAEPWEFSASQLLGAHLSRGVRLVPRALDTLGQIRLSPHTVAVDQRTDVPWADIVAIRARPLLEVVTADFVDKLSDRILTLVRTPIVRPAARFVTERAPEVILSIVMTAINDQSRAANAMVPVEITYRAGRRKTRTMTPGILSTAVLCLPPVANSLLTTASCRNVPVTVERHQGDPSVEHTTRLLTQRMRLAARQIRGTDDAPLAPADTADIESGTLEAETATEAPPPPAEGETPPPDQHNHQLRRRRPSTPYTGLS